MNVAEYEALLFGLISALKLGVRKLRVQGEVNGEFALKEAALVEYKTAIRKLVKSFSTYNLSMFLGLGTNMQMLWLRWHQK